MNSEWFEKVINKQIDMCKNVLINKAKEYSDDSDRLHNFKNAAGMMGCDNKEALAGMMAKHTISIYDMCRSGKDYPIELWDEKITDHINYLLLLKAVVTEEKYDVFLEKFQKDPHVKYEPVPGMTLMGNQFDTDEDVVKIAKKVEEVIRSLKICIRAEDGCTGCAYINDGDCSTHIKQDAMNLLERARNPEYEPAPGVTLMGNQFDTDEDVPKPKFDPEDLNKAIENVRGHIENCSLGYCDSCPHSILNGGSERCGESFLDEYDNLIARLKEVSHEST